MGHAAQVADVGDDARGLYRAALGVSGALDEWRLDGFDRTGIPVMSTLWRPFDGSSPAYGIGYGSTWESATVGAWGETAEGVVMNATIPALELQVATYADLVAQVGPDGVADPLTLTLPAGSDYAPDRPIGWVPSLRWRTGESVWLPVEFAATARSQWAADAPDPLITPITNGLGAGESLERAVGHGLLELIQRDGDTVSFRALDQGDVIDLAGLTDPVALAALARLREAGIEPLVKLAYSRFACVVYAAGRDPDPSVPLAPSAIGECAHPDGQTAIAGALLEFASSRARRSMAFGPLAQVERVLPDYYDIALSLPLVRPEPRALAAMRRWTEMPAADLRALVEPYLLRSKTVGGIADLPVVPAAETATPAALLDHLLGRLTGFDVLVVPGRLGDVHAAKVVVPGLEVETMSYHRIGERILRWLLHRRSPLVGLGLPEHEGQQPIRLTDAATQRIGGPAWLDTAAVDALVEPLYPLYREPGRHVVQRTPIDPPGETP